MTIPKNKWRKPMFRGHFDGEAFFPNGNRYDRQNIACDWKDNEPRTKEDEIGNEQREQMKPTEL